MLDPYTFPPAAIIGRVMERHSSRLHLGCQKCPDLEIWRVCQPRSLFTCQFCWKCCWTQRYHTWIWKITMSMDSHKSQDRKIGIGKDRNHSHLLISYCWYPVKLISTHSFFEPLKYASMNHFIVLLFLESGKHRNDMHSCLNKNVSYQNLWFSLRYSHWKLLYHG